MRIEAKYRLAVLVVLAGILGVSALFLRLARSLGQSQVSLSNLPASVVRAVAERAGSAIVLVQIDERETPCGRRTFVVHLEHPSGSSERLWLAEDGSDWSFARRR